MAERIWILGASDPEMEAIEGLLREAGERIIYALGPDGQRVRADNAYRVTALSEPVPAGATVCRVECDGPAIPSDAVVIDHHRPGDPGYGRPPEEFLPASSLGQVIAELARQESLPAGWRCEEQGLESGPAGRIKWNQYGPYWHVGITPADASRRLSWGELLYAHSLVLPNDIVLTAAADHCLAAAYRGECPGVDPDALMHWRAASRAAFQRRSVDDVLADVERARLTLCRAPTVRLDETAQARDLRGQQIPELPEAAARDGVCFLASISERDGRVKVVCQSGTLSQIEAFMRVWAPEHGLTDIYGDPARGFAGGYKSL